MLIVAKREKQLARNALAFYADRGRWPTHGDVNRESGFKWTEERLRRARLVFPSWDESQLMAAAAGTVPKKKSKKRKGPKKKRAYNEETPWTDAIRWRLPGSFEAGKRG